MIAFCGLKCDECSAFIATEADDDLKRREAAELWSKQFNTVIKKEDINCKGCVSRNNVLFRHCHVCEIRKCGLSKGIMNCAYCADYACDKLENFFKIVPEVKKTLEVVRKAY